MPTYAFDSASRVVAKARSSIHDTTTTWDRVTGTVDTDPETLETDGATCSAAVDMTSFDAGDWLKNRKLKKDLDVGSHPRAEFSLVGLEDIERGAGGAFTAVARGVIRWRDRESQIVARGKGVVTADRIEATATFDLDVTTLGVKPPKILMFKVEKDVSIEVTLIATATR